MIRCDECGALENDEDLFCSKCGTKRNIQIVVEKSKKKGVAPSTIAGLVLLFLLVLLYFKGCNDRTTVNDGSNLRKEAFYNANEFMKMRLKSPSSAKFPSYNEGFVNVNDQNQYVVISYVDSQNSFGAMLRTKFRAILVPTEDSWKCIELITDSD